MHTNEHSDETARIEADVRRLLASVQGLIDQGHQTLAAQGVATQLVAILLPDVVDQLAVAVSDLSVLEAVDAVRSSSGQGA